RPSDGGVRAAAGPARGRHAPPGRRLEDGGPDRRRGRRAARLLAADRRPEAGSHPRHLEQRADAQSGPDLSPAALRRIDQAGDRLEVAWKEGRRPDPAGFLGTATGPERSALLRQLLLLDWEYRQRAGDTPRAADYDQRFPGDTAVIADVSREAAADDGRSGA